MSKIKYNLLKENRGPICQDFDNAVQYFLTLKSDIIVLDKVNGRHVSDMNRNDFLFLLYNLVVVRKWI